MSGVEDTTGTADGAPEVALGSGVEGHMRPAEGGPKVAQGSGVEGHLGPAEGEPEVAPGSGVEGHVGSAEGGRQTGRKGGRPRLIDVVQDETRPVAERLRATRKALRRQRLPPKRVEQTTTLCTSDGRVLKTITRMIEE